MLLSGAAGDSSWLIGLLSQSLLRLFFSLLISIASYVLTGLGLHTAAKRRGIRYPWLAWIPLGQLWILGRIADHYQCERNSRVYRWSFLLMITSVLSGLFSAFMSKSYSNILVMILQAFFDGGDIIRVLEENVGGLLIVTAIHLLIALIAAVIEYIALYTYYKSCLPKKAKAFLVLSILISVTRPFFVFYCRKWDLGMAEKTAAAST